MKKLSQQDNKWKNQKLGTGKNTIGSHGCAITCLSMMAGVTPDYTNNLLRDNKGYVNGDLVNWTKASQLLGLEYNSDINNQVYYPTIMRVFSKQIPMHFVIWMGGDLIIDPLDGKEKQYRTSGYTFHSWRNVKLKEVVTNNNIMTKDEFISITRIINRGEFNQDPKKGLHINIDHYYNQYLRNRNEFEKIMDSLFQNILDIKSKQGIRFLDSKEIRYRTEADVNGK
jgi:hypothetical protein